MSDAGVSPVYDRHHDGDTSVDTDLVVMLIEFDEDGNSVGKSWHVVDPVLKEYFRHLSTHLGDPMTESTGDELERQYGPCEDDEDGEREQ